MEETGREQEGDQQTEESNARGAPPEAGEATEGPPWCVFSSPFAPEKVGSGMGWMDEQDKYGPPLVAMFGEEGAASGSNRQKVGDGSIVAAQEWIQESSAGTVPRETLRYGTWLCKDIVLKHAPGPMRDKLESIAQDAPTAMGRYLGATIYAMAALGVYPLTLWASEGPSFPYPQGALDGLRIQNNSRLKLTWVDLTKTQAFLEASSVVLGSIAPATATAAGTAPTVPGPVPGGSVGTIRILPEDLAALSGAQRAQAEVTRKVANSQPDVQQEVKERKRANPEAVESALSDAAIAAQYRAHAVTQSGLPKTDPEQWHAGMVKIGTAICTQATGADVHQKTMASAIMTGKVLNLATDNQWCANLLNSVSDAVKEEITNYIQGFTPFDKKNGTSQIAQLTKSFLTRG